MERLQEGVIFRAVHKPGTIAGKHDVPDFDATGDLMDLAADRIQALEAERAKPIPMILFCPACGEQHIDEPEPSLGKRFLDPGAKEWTNPPHRSHLCQGCGHIWRPADVATEGVARIETAGKADSEPAEPQPALQAAEAEVVRLREGLEQIAVEEFSGSPGMSIYAAGANELGRLKKLARALLSDQGPK